MTDLQRPVVSVVALTDAPTPRRVLLQERRGRDDTPYSGTYEVPQGKVLEGVSIAEFARYKLHSESGLDLTRFLAGGDEPYTTVRTSSDLYVSTPWCCVIDVVQNHFAVAVVALARGEFHDTADATGHRWCDAGELDAELDANTVFPLNVPMLRRLIAARAEFGF